MTDNDDNQGSGGKKLTPTEMAIIEMMKKQSLQGHEIVQGDTGIEILDEERKRHAFWDTQVCNLRL